MTKFGYIRVSTVQQNIGRQLITMQAQGVDIGKLDPATADERIFNSIRSGNVFIDKLSGKDTNRPMFQELLNTVQSGDTIVFDEISRMGRNLKDIVNTTEQLVNNDINIKFVKENIDPNTSVGKAMLGMFGVVAQLERDLMLERTKEGVAIAKEKGKYHGRQPLVVDEHTLNMIMSQHIKHRLSVRDAANMIVYTMASGEKKVGVSIPTFYKLKDQWLSDNNIEKVEYIHKDDAQVVYDDSNIPDSVFDDMEV